MKAVSTPITAKLAYTYREAAQQLGVCERLIWQAVKDGKLTAARFGRSVRIPAEALQDYVARSCERA